MVVEFEHGGEQHKTVVWTSNPLFLKNAESECASLLKRLHNDQGMDVMKVVKIESTEHEIA